jgi:AAA+ ATPase superfamily predicted ATPase
VLALDEFPNLVQASRDLPSLLQKRLDQHRGPHLVLCGSSQRMMQGLVLDRSAPLYGRAREILKITPLTAGWLGDAFANLNPLQQIETYALWGGIPRYWELAREFPTQSEALQDLVLSPLGVLHDEPRALLQDDLSDTLQSASLLQLIGQGCQRLSELAARLGKPATSLTRPLQRLVELDLILRQRPFGSLEKDSKRSYYRISDPFLRFWYRYIAPRRSRLQARQIAPVLAEIQRDMDHHVAGIWEDLARESLARLELFGMPWQNAQPWWGPGLDHKPLEIDLVAETPDRSALLIGSVKWQKGLSRPTAWNELLSQADRFPEANGRPIHLCLFSQKPGKTDLGPQQILTALRG